MIVALISIQLPKKFVGFDRLQALTTGCSPWVDSSHLYIQANQIPIMSAY